MRERHATAMFVAFSLAAFKINLSNEESDSLMNHAEDFFRRLLRGETIPGPEIDPLGQADHFDGATLSGADQMTVLANTGILNIIEDEEPGHMTSAQGYKE